MLLTVCKAPEIGAIKKSRNSIKNFQMHVKGGEGMLILLPCKSVVNRIMDINAAIMLVGFTNPYDPSLHVLQSFGSQYFSAQGLVMDIM